MTKDIPVHQKRYTAPVFVMGTYISSKARLWIRINFNYTDPDPAFQLNPDPVADARTTEDHRRHPTDKVDFSVKFILQSYIPIT
jgi:hypothetical protein